VVYKKFPANQHYINWNRGQRDRQREREKERETESDFIISELTNLYTFVLKKSDITRNKGQKSIVER